MVQFRFTCCAALALGLATLAACSDSGPVGPDPSGIVRLDLVATVPEPRARDVVVVKRLDWPEDSSLVQLVNAQAKWIAGMPAQPQPQLQVSAQKADSALGSAVSVKLRGSFDPGAFNKVVVSASSLRDCYVHCVFRSKGRPILGSTNRGRLAAAETSGAISKAVLDLPGARSFNNPPDELELMFDSVCGPFVLGSIELCSQPIWSWLPAAEQGFGMVDLAGDSRNSVGLSTARTLETEAQVPPHAELVLSVGIPGMLNSVGLLPLMRIEVQGQGGSPLIQTVPLEAATKEQPRWHKLRVPLERFAGQRVRIVFSFNVADPQREAVCAITRPRIAIRRRSSRTVLLVTSDTHRADGIGAASAGAAIQTPVLDQLAQRGVFFEDCWSSTNVTIPSHVAIMTATSPRDSGIFDNYSRLSRSARTLAEAFQDAGFLTYAVVSAPHLADLSSGLGQGFDRLSAPVDTNKRPAELSVTKMRSWIEEAEGQDLFLWLHVFDAHGPYAPPKEFEELYWPAGRDAFDPHLPEPELPAAYRVNLPKGVRDLGLLSARYSGEISYLDQQLAALFDVPRVKAGVIAMTADHGESLGEHGIFWDHGGLYPQTIHVPLIVAWPSAPGGTRVKAPVFQLDLAQTLLTLAGVVDKSIPGTDLFSATARAPEPRFTIAASAERASVTKDQWHLILSLRVYMVTAGAAERQVPKHHVELYDLSKDPKCEHDLARDELPRARDLRRLLCAWLAAAEPRGWAARENASAEMAQHLAQLGYTAQTSMSTLNAVDLDCTCAECAPFLKQK